MLLVPLFCKNIRPEKADRHETIEAPTDISAGAVLVYIIAI